MRSGPLRDAMLQRDALHQFHRDERYALVFVDIVNRADIRMVQRGRSASLALESLERGRISRDAQRHKFQRHLPPQLRILSAIHHAHPAAAHLLDDAVMRYLAPNVRISLSHPNNIRELARAERTRCSPVVFPPLPH